MTSAFYRRHTPPKVQLNYERQNGGGPIWFAHGASNARVVAILGRKGADFQTLNVVTDTKGRYILLKIRSGQESFTLGNIHAPTQDHYNDKVEFIEELEDRTVALEPENLILGGDFNLCMNPELDRNSGNTGRTNRLNP